MPKMNPVGGPKGGRSSKSRPMNGGGTKGGKLKAVKGGGPQSGRSSKSRPMNGGKKNRAQKL